jgi:Ca2+-binding EF-hand superfamily protein
MNEDGLGQFLETKKIYMSKELLRRMFDKIDTSDDGLISLREIRMFMNEWRPMSNATRLEQVRQRLVTALNGS